MIISSFVCIRVEHNIISLSLDTEYELQARKMLTKPDAAIKTRL